MAPQKTTQNAGQNADQATTQETSWIPGAKPNFQTLRVSVAQGRAFLGAQGWCKKMEGNQWVSLEMTAAGLHAGIKAFQVALKTLQET